MNTPMPNRRKEQTMITIEEIETRLSDLELITIKLNEIAEEQNQLNKTTTETMRSLLEVSKILSKKSY